MAGNKDRRKSGEEPAEFVWGSSAQRADPEASRSAAGAALPPTRPGPEAAPQQPESFPPPQSPASHRPAAAPAQPAVRSALSPEPPATTAFTLGPAPGPEPGSPRPGQRGYRPSRRALNISAAALAVCAGGCAVYAFGFAGSSAPRTVHTDVQSAASSGALLPAVPTTTASARASVSASPSRGPVDAPSYASPSHPPAVGLISTISTTHAAQVAQTPPVAPASPATKGAVVISTPSPEVTATAATAVSGSIQCQSTSVEGVWVQSANGGSGWAPWVSSAANPDHATYSYTLPKGGEYSLHVGCGGTTSTWKVAAYSDFYGGTVNDFYCYDESGSTLYTYCSRTS